MRHVLAFLAIMLPFTATAEEEQTLTTQQWCKVVETIAKLAISERYSGRSLNEVLERGYHIDIYREIVLDAYSRPEWLSPESIEHESRAFVNQWALTCYEVNR